MKKCSPESGAALIEFSILFPICFVLFLGMVDLCGWLKSQLLLSRVAYEGARYASVIPAIEDENDPRVTRRLQHVIRKMNQKKKQILAPVYLVTKNDTDNTIEVQVESKHEFLFLPQNFFGLRQRVTANVSTAYLFEA